MWSIIQRINTICCVRLGLLVCLAFIVGQAFGQVIPADVNQDRGTTQARTLVHLLDYISQDYASAVEGGKVIDKAEYAEMKQFSDMVISLLDGLMSEGFVSQNDALVSDLTQVRSLVLALDSTEKITSLTRSIREKIISLTELRVAPSVWPDLDPGRSLFQKTCSACHGARGAGDGPLATTLKPQPTDFVRGARVALLSPFQVYNTIKLGVVGTAMPAFEVLTEDELWELSFFVKSLKEDNQFLGKNVNRQTLNRLHAAISLEEMASLNDPELILELENRGFSQPEAGLFALRTNPKDEVTVDFLIQAEQYLQIALEHYRKGEVGQARSSAINAYLLGIEPVEPTLKAIDLTLANALEESMMVVRTVIENRGPIEELVSVIDKAMNTISSARDTMQESGQSIWFVFFMAATILLREGLEAFLIIIAILGVIRATGHDQAARWVHSGWIFALILGVVSWILSNALLKIGASQREVLEGGIAILAVFVLLYLGFWLHSKTEIHKWKAFIDEKINQKLKQGNLLGLFVFSFFAVFREAFESVLFLSALTLEQGSQAKMAVAAGALTALVLVLVAGAILMRFSKLLPVHNLFRYASFMMGVLAVVLAGKGIHAFQEVGRISVSVVPIPLRIDIIGFYPTIETLIAQFAVLLVAALLWISPRLVQRSR